MWWKFKDYRLTNSKLRGEMLECRDTNNCLPYKVNVLRFFKEVLCFERPLEMVCAYRMYGRDRDFYGTGEEIPERICHWVHICVDGKIILKWTLQVLLCIYMERIISPRIKTCNDKMWIFGLRWKRKICTVYHSSFHECKQFFRHHSRQTMKV